MKRTTVLSVILSAVVLSLALVVMTGTVAAQRPGRPTPVATVDRSDSSAKRTPIATPNATQPTRQRPNAATPIATFSLPLNLTLTPHGTLPIPASSDEATTVINSFASIYLGTSYDFLYAGSLGRDKTDASWDAFVAQLPESVQWYITAFSTAAGGSYWGVFKNGMGMTAIGDCTDNPTCMISMDNLNVYLTTASAGVYSAYTSGTAANPNDALTMIHTVYPSLNTVALEEVTADQGYAFQAATYETDVSNQQVTAASHFYVAGVVKVATQSLVYAVVGIGDGFVGMSQ